MKFKFGVLVLCLVMLSLSLSPVAVGQIVDLKLTGVAGDGLLPGNVTPGTSSTGFGGEGDIGLLFDLDTNTLTVDIEWGSGNGFGDLTGEVTMLHLHGPTDNRAPRSFTQRGPLLINLGASLNFDSSATDGGLNETYFINPTNVNDLLQGRFYINVHTQMYEMGEIRGYVVRSNFVPEPGSIGLLAGLAGMMIMRRRRHPV